MKKPNKMAAVKAFLSTNPTATATQIAAGLAKQKIRISVGVASNYKSVIKSGSKRARRKKAGRKGPATTPRPLVAKTTASASSNGSAGHGLAPEVKELLKAGRSLGWKQVKSIVDLMLGM